MAGCNTGRNVQKYKGSGASTLQDALENGNTAPLTINLTSPGVFVGDGGGLSNISASSTTGNLQSVTDNGATTTNKITFSNGVTSLQTSGNVVITGNVTATDFRGDGGTLSNISANKNFQEVTDIGATTTNKITLTNSATSLQTTGKIVSLTLEANVNASNIVTADGRGINQLNASNVSIGTLAIARGGTGADTASAAASALGVGTEDSPQFTAIELGHASDTTLARSSAGVVTIEGVEIRTGTVPVAKGGTGATSASGAASALGVGTEDSPQFTAIELGHASDTTLARSSAGVVTIEGVEIRTGTVPVAKGGTGATTLNNLITMGTHTSGDFVGTITGGDGIASSAGTTGEDTDHTLSIDAKANGGLVIESNKLAVDLAASSITGTLAVGDGGTGATTLDNLITMGTHTSGNFVQTITGGDGIASTGATSGENIAHSLSVDAKANGGLVIESGELAVDLAASSITGTLAVGDGGTGATTLNNLITMGTHTSGDFVGTITGGDGIASTGATSGENIAHSLSVDVKANGGLVFDSGELAVNLAASSITGTLTAGDGGTGHSSYTVGQLLVANTVGGVVTLTKLTPGTSGHFLKSQGSGSHLEWASVAEIGSATPGELITGSYLTGGPTTLAEDTTIAADATTTNTAGKLVARDDLGDIYASNVSSSSNVNAITLKANVIASNIVSADGRGINQLNASNVSIGRLAIARGGTGSDTLNDLITMGTHTTGDFVQNITGGNGIASTGATSGENIAHSLSVDVKANGGLVFESNKLAVDAGASSITGVLSVDNGGTGSGTLNDLITMGTHTTGDFVQNITGGNGIASTGATSGENIAHSLSVDAKANGGLVIESGELAVDLGASSITGRLAVGDGGTGLSTVTAGDILYASADDTIAARTKGSDGQFLTLSSGLPTWASVSSTTMTVTNDADSTNDQGIIYAEGTETGIKSLESDADTLKYKRSTGTLTTSNVITSDTSVDARNGIANTTSTHTLSVGTVVSIRESASGDVFIVRKGDGYFSENVYIAKKLTIPVGGEIVADTIKCRSFSQKGTTVVAERIVDEVTVGSS